MSPATTPRRRAAGLAAAALLVPLATSACSADEEEGGEATSTTVPLGSAEDEVFDCPDPTGDLLPSPTTADDEPSGDPASVDLVDVHLDVTGDALEVEFTVAADVESAPGDPRFIVYRGTRAAQEGGFELQAFRRADGTWAVELTDYFSDIGNVQPLAVAVTVQGATVGLSVPKDQLPPLGAVIGWYFGSFHRALVEDPTAPTTAADPSTTLPPGVTTIPPGFREVKVFDDCSPYGPAIGESTTTSVGADPTTTGTGDGAGASTSSTGATSTTAPD